MERSNFENLQVYQLSEDLADNIWEIVIEWNQFARDTVGKQMVRAADSIGANIAEGSGRKSYADNKRFVFMARDSVNQTKHWLRRAYKRGLFSSEQIQLLNNNRYVSAKAQRIRKFDRTNAENAAARQQLTTDD